MRQRKRRQLSDDCSETLGSENLVANIATRSSRVKNVIYYHMSHVLRKPVFGVSDQVRHKPSFMTTEDG